jgi:hypothetical protein
MGFFSEISDKIAEIRQHSKDKKEFFANLIRAAEDGKLTDDEIKEIQVRYKELELTQDDLKGIRVRAYSAALNAAKSDGMVTAEEEAELGKLQQFLMIPETEIENSKKELAKLRLLTEIQNGNPPSISVRNIILQKSELAYWSEPASLFEERVVNRRYEGGSQSVSFRIAKGVSYRIGAQRGHIVADTAIVPVSSGELVVTSKRVIFRGDAKSFSLKLDKLLELNLFGNGVRLTDAKGKPRMVKFADEGNADVVGATLSFAINQYVS